MDTPSKLVLIRNAQASAIVYRKATTKAAKLRRLAESADPTAVDKAEAAAAKAAAKAVKDAEAVDKAAAAEAAAAKAVKDAEAVADAEAAKGPTPTYAAKVAAKRKPRSTSAAKAAAAAKRKPRSTSATKAATPATTPAVTTIATTGKLLAAIGMPEASLVEISNVLARRSPEEMAAADADVAHKRQHAMGIAIPLFMMGLCAVGDPYYMACFAVSLLNRNPALATALVGLYLGSQQHPRARFADDRVPEMPSPNALPLMEALLTLSENDLVFFLTQSPHDVYLWACRADVRKQGATGPLTDIELCAQMLVTRTAAQHDTAPISLLRADIARMFATLIIAAKAAGDTTNAMSAAICRAMRDDRIEDWITAFDEASPLTMTALGKDRCRSVVGAPAGHAARQYYRLDDSNSAANCFAKMSAFMTRFTRSCTDKKLAQDMFGESFDTSGIIVLVGECGCGKTTCFCSAAAAIGTEMARARAANPNLCPQFPGPAMVLVVQSHALAAAVASRNHMYVANRSSGHHNQSQMPGAVLNAESQAVADAAGPGNALVAFDDIGAAGAPREQVTIYMGATLSGVDDAPRTVHMPASQYDTAGNPGAVYKVTVPLMEIIVRCAYGHRPSLDEMLQALSGVIRVCTHIRQQQQRPEALVVVPIASIQGLMQTLAAAMRALPGDMVDVLGASASTRSRHGMPPTVGCVVESFIVAVCRPKSPMETGMRGLVAQAFDNMELCTLLLNSTTHEHPSTGPRSRLVAQLLAVIHSIAATRMSESEMATDIPTVEALSILLTALSGLVKRVRAWVAPGMSDVAVVQALAKSVMTTDPILDGKGKLTLDGIILHQPTPAVLVLVAGSSGHNLPGDVVMIITNPCVGNAAVLRTGPKTEPLVIVNAQKPSKDDDRQYRGRGGRFGGTYLELEHQSGYSDSYPVYPDMFTRQYLEDILTADPRGVNSAMLRDIDQCRGLGMLKLRLCAGMPHVLATVGVTMGKAIENPMFAVLAMKYILDGDMTHTSRALLRTYAHVVLMTQPGSSLTAATPIPDAEKHVDGYVESLRIAFAARTGLVPRGGQKMTPEPLTAAATEILNRTKTIVQVPDVGRVSVYTFGYTGQVLYSGLQYDIIGPVTMAAFSKLCQPHGNDLVMDPERLDLVLGALSKAMGGNRALTKAYGPHCAEILVTPVFRALAQEARVLVEGLVPVYGAPMNHYKFRQQLLGDVFAAMHAGYSAGPGVSAIEAAMFRALERWHDAACAAKPTIAAAAARIAATCLSVPVQICMLRRMVHVVKDFIAHEDGLSCRISAAINASALFSANRLLPRNAATFYMIFAAIRDGEIAAKKSSMTPADKEKAALESLKRRVATAVTHLAKAAGIPVPPKDLLDAYNGAGKKVFLAMAQDMRALYQKGKAGDLPKNRAEYIEESTDGSDHPRSPFWALVPRLGDAAGVDENMVQVTIDGVPALDGGIPEPESFLGAIMVHTAVEGGKDGLLRQLKLMLCQDMESFDLIWEMFFGKRETPFLNASRVGEAIAECMQTNTDTAFGGQVPVPSMAPGAIKALVLFGPDDLRRMKTSGVMPQAVTLADVHVFLGAISERLYKRVFTGAFMPRMATMTWAQARSTVDVIKAADQPHNVSARVVVGLGPCKPAPAPEGGDLQFQRSVDHLATVLKRSGRDVRDSVRLLVAQQARVAAVRRTELAVALMSAIEAAVTAACRREEAVVAQDAAQDAACIRSLETEVVNAEALGAAGKATSVGPWDTVIPPALETARQCLKWHEARVAAKNPALIPGARERQIHVPLSDDVLALVAGSA